MINDKRDWIVVRKPHGRSYKYMGQELSDSLWKIKHKESGEVFDNEILAKEWETARIRKAENAAKAKDARLAAIKKKAEIKKEV